MLGPALRALRRSPLVPGRRRGLPRNPGVPSKRSNCLILTKLPPDASSQRPARSAPSATEVGGRSLRRHKGIQRGDTNECAAPFAIEEATGLPILKTTVPQEYTIAGDAPATGINGGTTAMSILFNGQPILEQLYC